LTCVVYCNTLLNEFAYDDQFVYANNHWLADLRNLPQLFGHDYLRFSAETGYHPVVTFTYFADGALWWNWPAGPHLTNLLLYTGLVFVLFFFVRDVTGSAWSAAFAAGLFAIHPLHTEVVNSICFREYLLAGLLLPASWLLYKRGLRERQWLWMPLAWLCYFLATLSNKVALIFPVLVVLLEFTETQSSQPLLRTPRRLWNLAGLLCMTILYVVIRVYWLRFAGETQPPRLGGSMLATLLASARIHGHYLLLLFCPYQMRAIYPQSMYGAVADTTFFVSFSTLLVLAAFLLYFRRERFFVLGILWWFAALLPVSNLIPIAEPMAERYLFLASIGPCLWIGWLIGAAFEAGRRTFLIAGAGFLALMLGALTFLRNSDWHDDRTLWQATAESDPANPRVLANLALAHHAEGKYELAIDQASRALQLQRASGEPFNVARIHLCVADSSFVLGRLDEALEHARLAESLLPSRADVDFGVYRTLGLIHDARGELETALTYYRAAADINRFQASLWMKISYCELRQGRRTEAEANWQKARQLDRNVPRFEEIETLYQKSRTRPPI